MENKGFYSHIEEAITINKKRKKQYAKLSNGKTKGLSNALIFSEMLTTPLAKYYDKKAKKFNDRGIMVVRDDFVEMDIPEYDTDVSRKSAWNPDVNSSLKSQLSSFIRNVPNKCKTDQELQLVLDNGRKLYTSIEKLEVDNNLHAIMTKHVLESICFLCMNGIKFSEQSNGETRHLSAALVKWHKIALKNTLWMDKWGNKFHQQNIGILVNDMPVIPIH